jgi:hypothetical protein
VTLLLALGFGLGFGLTTMTPSASPWATSTTGSWKPPTGSGDRPAVADLHQLKAALPRILIAAAAAQPSSRLAPAMSQRGRPSSFGPGIEVTLSCRWGMLQLSYLAVVTIETLLGMMRYSTPVPMLLPPSAGCRVAQP